MTKPLFIFGTLLHRPLLALVAGEDATWEHAALPGHAVQAVKDQAFPILTNQKGSAAKGILLRDLSDKALARLDFYESIFRYDRFPVSVDTQRGTIEAEVYLPEANAWQAAGPWDFAAWEAEHGRINVLAAQELMERYGMTAPDDLARLYPFIRARAWARRLAETRPSPTLLRRASQPGDVEVLRHSTPHEGFFRLKQFQLRARRYDGSQGRAMEREAFLGFDAALVLPYDPKRDLVLMVEQFRLAPYWRGDPEPFILEPVAGIVDAGEEPAQAARREALEEAGLTLGEMIPAGSGYAAPGYVTEYHHCFIGLCDLDRPARQIGGVASEDEDICAHVVPFDTAMALMESGEINAMPLIMMLLKLASLRNGLRAHP